MRRPGMTMLAILYLFGCSSSGSDTKDTATDLLNDVVEDETSDVATPDSTHPEDSVSDLADTFAYDTVDASDVSVDAPDSQEDVFAPPEMPHALCGMPDYDILPRSEVGELLDWEPIPFWNMGATDVDTLLATAGYQGMSPVPCGVKFYKYRYTTQDRGVALEATAMLGVPTGEGCLDGALPLILNTHGTTGISDPCAPSFPGNELEGGAVPALLTSLGFPLVAPDYIGMNGMGEASSTRHAYLGGEQVAIGSWDSVRAAEQLLQEIDETVLTDGRVVPWGGSQGGHAALFCELYAPYYAPEDEVPAVIAMIPPLALVPLVQESVEDIKSGTGLLGLSLATLYLWYGEQGSLAEVFTDEEPLFFASQGLDLIFPQEKCEIDVDVDVSEATIDMLFTEFFIEKAVAGDWDALEPWSCFYRENSLTDTSVERLRITPTLVILGEEDDLVYTPPMRTAFEELCQDGYRFDYLECANAGHTDAALWSLPTQLEWLQARLAGEPIPEEELCVVQEPTCCAASPEGKCDPE